MKTTTKALIALWVVLLALPAAAQLKADLNPVVWRINGDPLYAAEISLTMQNIAAQARSAGGPPPDTETLMQAATQRMIGQKLLVQEARRLAIRNNQERLAAMVKAMEEQSGGREALQEMLARGGSTYEQAVQVITEQDLVLQLIDTQIAPAIKVERPEVEAYYKEHAEKFTGKARIRARHIVFSAIDGDPPARMEKARAKAEAARERAVAGEDFAALAKELSEGPSGPQGGDLGFFSAEQMEEPFADTAFALEVGEISPVVQTRYGFHVIKLEAKRPAGQLHLDEVEQSIATRIHQEKISERVTGLLESLRKSGTIEPEVHGSAPAAAPSGGQS